MKKTKGMSQTLALIVAASVLMMTALTVIFLAQGALGDFGQDSNNRACNSALQAQLSAMGYGDTARIPSNCFTADGNAVNGAPTFVEDAASNDQQCMTTSSATGSGTPSISEMTATQC